MTYRSPDRMPSNLDRSSLFDRVAFWRRRVSLRVWLAVSIPTAALFGTVAYVDAQHIETIG